MEETNLTFSAALRALASEDLTDSHPDPEGLIALADGRLVESQAVIIRSHLTICEKCAQTVLDLGSFPEIEIRDPSKALTADEEAQDWQWLRSRLASAPETPPLLFRPRPRPSYFLLASIAALVLTVVGLSIWISSLRRIADSSVHPAANIYIRELTAAGGSEARASTGEAVSPPKDAERVLFILSFGNFQQLPRTKAEIVDERGSILWRHEGLVRMPDGSFTLELPSRFLPPGRYEIHLAAVETPGARPLATYPFRFSPATVP